MRPLVLVRSWRGCACAGSSGDGSLAGRLADLHAERARVGQRATSRPEPSGTRTSRTAALDPQSAAVIANLDRAGWGLGRMQIDFSIEVLTADASTPLRPFTPTEDFFSPDCDLDPVPGAARRRPRGRAAATSAGATAIAT